MQYIAVLYLDLMNANVLDLLRPGVQYYLVSRGTEVAPK